LADQVSEGRHTARPQRISKQLVADATCVPSADPRLAIAEPAEQIPLCKLLNKGSTGMKAVGYKKSLPVDAADPLIDFGLRLRVHALKMGELFVASTKFPVVNLSLEPAWQLDAHIVIV